jgi:hypothetical protein
MMTSILFLVAVIALSNLVFIVISKISSNRRFAKEQLELARIVTKQQTVKEVNTSHDSVGLANNQRISTVNSSYRTSMQILNNFHENISQPSSLNSPLENFR